MKKKNRSYLTRSITIRYYYADADGGYTDFDPSMTETVTGVKIGRSVRASDHLDGKDKTGFTFDSEATIPSYVTAVKGTDELILKVYFKRNRHTIFYAIDGDYFAGEYKKIENVRYGTALSLITDDMTKEGYTFQGWNGLPDTMPDTDVTVTGHYTINRYDVTYEYTGAIPAGATAPGTQTYNYNAGVVVAPLPPTVAHYTFHGWTKNGIAVDAGSEITMPAGSVTIKGNWTKNGMLTINWDSAERTYTGSAQSLITVKTPSGAADDGATFTWQQLQSAGYSVDLTKNGTGTHAGAYEGLVTGPSTVTIGGVVYDVIYTYDGQTIAGGAKLTVTPVELKVTTPNASKVYDGEALTAEGSVSGFVNGETATFETTGTQTGVGTSENGYSLKYDQTARETDYTVSKSVGTLTVTENADEIVVTTRGGSYAYDGTAHGATVTVSELPKGYTLEKAVSGASATHVSEGTVTATCDTLVIRNAAGEDVTGKLKIQKVDGSIAVTPVELKVTTPNASKVYDGEALTAEGSVSGFVNGETATFETTGTQTGVGTSENGYSLKYDQTARETDYTVSKSVGTLTVTPQMVTIRAKNLTYWYNALAQGPQGTTYTTTVSDYATWPTLSGTQTVSSITIEGGSKDAGTYKDALVPVEAIITDGTQDVTANYTLLFDAGDLVIMKRGASGDPKGPVTITAKDETHLYNASVQGPQGATYTATMGDHATWTALEGTDALTSLMIAGGQRDMGTYAGELIPSDAVLMNGDLDVGSNYELTYVNGDLTINPQYFTVIFADYNGNVLQRTRVLYGGSTTPPGDPGRSG